MNSRRNGVSLKVIPGFNRAQASGEGMVTVLSQVNLPCPSKLSTTSTLDGFTSTSASRCPSSDFLPHWYVSTLSA